MHRSPLPGSLQCCIATTVRHFYRRFLALGRFKSSKNRLLPQKAMMNRMIWPGIRDEIEISKLDCAVVLSNDTSRAQ
ncbi:hypothetical protein QF001_003931 [Paraburkholderia youngii]|uniref:hypothetical protein n=1 Tax=Paraburkholderia youngii TaxID=2782701 RepID=UPI003D1CDD7A